MNDKYLKSMENLTDWIFIIFIAILIIGCIIIWK